MDQAANSKSTMCVALVGNLKFDISQRYFHDKTGLSIIDIGVHGPKFLEF